MLEPARERALGHLSRCQPREESLHHYEYAEQVRILLAGHQGFWGLHDGQGRAGGGPLYEGGYEEALQYHEDEYEDVEYHVGRSEEHTSELQSRLHLVC